MLCTLEILIISAHSFCLDNIVTLEKCCQKELVVIDIEILGKSIALAMLKKKKKVSYRDVVFPLVLHMG